MWTPIPLFTEITEQRELVRILETEKSHLRVETSG